MKTIEQADLILVDTSIWIDFFRKRENIFEQLNQLVEEKRVATVKLVIAELIQGARQEKEIEVIKNLGDVIPILTELSDAWEKAGKLSYDLRKKGKTVGLADCYIAIMAGIHNACLFSLDQHFRTISKYYPLKMFKN